MEARIIEGLCQRYPAYTPETAAQAPTWLLLHLNILKLAGERIGGDVAESGNEDEDFVLE